MKKINIFKQLIILTLLSSSLFCYTQNDVLTANPHQLKKNKTILSKSLKNIEASPNISEITVTTSRLMWDILFSYNVAGIQEAGVETDGCNIYTSRWNGAIFYKYSMAGTLLDSFSIPGVSGIRDLAFDGTYFYGGSNTAIIYVMDFTSHTLIGTIACPAGTTVRNIAYDPVLNGFWVGGWNTNINCINSSGTILSTIPAANLGMTGMYGSAYDKWTPGGPFLWILDQGTAGNGAFFNQINLATQLPTGLVYDCSDISPTAVAGGAFCFNNNGTVILGGNAQGEKIFGYELIANLAVGHCDISPMQLLGPLSTDILSIADSVSVKIANNDTIDHYDIPVSYSIDGGIAINELITDTIKKSSFIVYTFNQPYDFSSPGHVYNIDIYTSFGCDTVSTNDTLRTTTFNEFDASSNNINMLSIVGPGIINPSATFKNDGTITISFDVTMNIGTYTSAKTIINLGPGSSQQVMFDPFNATIGNYSILVYTSLANDMDFSNDTLTQSISVQNLTKVYCYVAYDPSLAVPVGPAYTYLQNPSVIISLADQSAENFIAAGTWGTGNKWYGVVFGENMLITIDTITGTRVPIGYVVNGVTGISFDYKTNTLYGVAWDGINSSLFSINQATGNSTLIGLCGPELLINLACDTLGNLYAISITNDLLFSVNKTTGVITNIGSIGFDAGYAQDMEFDQKTNICYFATFNVSSYAGELRTVDLINGNTILIGAFGGGAEITGFAIPYNSNKILTDASVATIISPSNDSSCTLTSNEHITLSIMNIGSDTLSGFDVAYQINNGAVITETVSDTIIPHGSLNYTFSHAENLSGSGPYVIKSFASVPHDINVSNDTALKTVWNTDASITVNIQTDYYGSETTWVLRTLSTGQIAASGGPYGDFSPQLFSTHVCVYSTDCYSFSIYDSFGDGICCDYGNGWYEILWENNSLGIIPGQFNDSANITNICAPSAIDAGVITITKPSTSCLLTSTEDVTFTIMNYGSDTIFNLQASYQINEMAPVTNTIMQTINPNDNLNYTFTGIYTVDLSAEGVYTISAYTTLNGDNNSSNDTAKILIINGPTSVPFSTGFEPQENTNGWKTEDANSDGYTWQQTSANGNNGPFCFRYSSSDVSAADDWLISRCIALESGKTYHLSYWYKVQNSGYAESFMVNIGTSPIPGSLNTMLTNHPDIINTSYIEGGTDFTVYSNGNYYIGFQCNSQANMRNLFLDDINLTYSNSIQEHTEISWIEVFPNPAENILNITSSKKISKIKMLNAFGQVVMTDKVNKSHLNLNISGIADGLYFLELETEIGVIKKSFTITR